MTSPYLLIIVGNSCTGKSTLIKELQKTLLGSYHIGYDRVKWGLAWYHRDRDQETIDRILDWFLLAIMGNGISCISDRLIREESRYQRMVELAEKHGYRLIYIWLECPEDILLERFRERVIRAKADPNCKIIVTDESLFLENAQKPIYFPEDTLKYDTSVQTTEDIAKDIFSILGR
jgi:predicted kinase